MARLSSRCSCWERSLLPLADRDHHTDQSEVRIVYQDLGYQAKWANLGATPADAVNDPAGSRWRPLYTIPSEPSS